MTFNLGHVVGANGVGITSIEKTSTSGLVDTYTITYTDNTTSTFTVTNGQDGHGGADIVTSWGSPVSDEKVPSEKLTKNTLDGKANYSHNHGNLANDGTIGSASGKVITTGNGGAIQASDISSVSGLDTALKQILYGSAYDTTAETKFNYAIIRKTVDGLVYEELWILSNAYYDYTHSRFVKQDITATSFGIQIQAKGTYPGEAELGYSNNTGINFWRCPIWKEHEDDQQYVVYMDTDYYDYTDTLANKYIGAEYDNSSWGSKNGTWREFGIATGWNNSFMTDSYGGITVGGAGFEIDGNGIFPFTRVTSSKYTDENDDVYYLLGILDNAYHPTTSGWQCDSNTFGAWFYGLKYPSNNDGTKSSEDAKFVIMYNDMSSIDPTASGYTIEDMDVSDWEIILEADTSSIKAMVNGTLTTLGGGSSTDIISQSITDGDTTHAPSGDAVYDALALKISTSSTAGLVKNDGSIDTNTYLTSSALSNYVQKSSTSGLIKNDGTIDTNSYITSSGLSNYIQKSSTTGLLKNDGTVDTNSYLTTTSASSTYVPKSDIVDNLTTNDATKVLSAKQGKELATLIGNAITYINQ